MINFKFARKKKVFHKYMAIFPMKITWDNNTKIITPSIIFDLVSIELEFSNHIHNF